MRVDTYSVHPFCFYTFAGMQHTIAIRVVELEEDNYHLMVTGTFPDETEGHWIIDTGASKTVFDKTLTDHYKILDSEHLGEMQSAGLGVDYIETEVGEIPFVTFNGYTTINLKVALIDLTHINNLYEKYTDLKICGLIGSDFLFKHKAIIDYSTMKLNITIEG